MAVGSGTTNRFGAASVDYVIPQALGIGAKPIVAQFAGEAEHGASSDTGTLSVVYPTSLAVSNVAGPVFSTVALSATLTRTTDGAPVPGQTVAFTVLYTAVGSGVTDASGVATCPFAIPSNIGDGPKPITAEFAAGGDYAGCTGTGVLTVSKVASALQVLDRTGIITEQVLLRAYLRRQSDGAPIPSRAVKFRIDGGPVGVATTDANGRATLPYVIPPAGGPGDRQITAIFDGDEDYLPCFGSATLAAQQVQTKMFGQNRTCMITDYTILKAYLFRLDNSPIIGREIGFMVDGTGVGAAPTNAQGRAQLGYVVADGAGAGDRPIVANWAGDPGYLPNSCTNTLTALKTLPYIWVLPKKAPVGSVDNLYAYFRRLYDYKPQAGKDVTFLIDGTAVHTMQTDASGVASFPYQTVEPVGTHTVRCEFAGDAWLEPGFGEGALTIF